MLSKLFFHFEVVGLEPHEKKTKILTNISNEFYFALVENSMLEIFDPCKGHKYLGRKLCMDADSRCDMEIQNRIQIAWMKFQKHRSHMTDKHVSLSLRLKLFDAIVIPTLFFALVTLPISSKNIMRLNSTIQRPPTPEERQ